MKKLVIVAVLAVLCLIVAPAIGAADAKGYGDQDGTDDGNQYQGQPDSPHGDQDGSCDGDQHQGPPQ